MINDIFISEAKLDNIITHNNDYLCVVISLDYLYNKRKYNRYINKFLDKCNYYSISFYNEIDDKYYIYDKKKMIFQIQNLKKNKINDHINQLNNFINNDITTSKYIDINNKATYMTQISLIDLDKFEAIINNVYMYNLLLVDNIMKYNDIIMSDYVDLSEINEKIILKEKQNIVYIDEYSDFEIK